MEKVICGRNVYEWLYFDGIDHARTERAAVCCCHKTLPQANGEHARQSASGAGWGCGRVLPGTSYDESLDAAVRERLSRVVQISVMQRDSAKEERDVIKALISDISHQVRTPLTNIMLYTGLLREQSLGKDAAALADKIDRQTEKLDFFMKELVKSSYTEQAMISVCPQMIDVEEVIDTACQMTELAAMKRTLICGSKRRRRSAVQIKSGPRKHLGMFWKMQ